MNKKWETYKIDPAKIENVSKKHNISKLTAQILLGREIETDEDIQKFLNPKLEDLYDPYEFKDMDLAVNRIIRAIDNNEKITIYGDYDVDGITSSTILVKFLKEQKADVGYYLPNRLTEGYGLNKNAIEQIKEKGTTLIITVDCGISAYDEIEYAKSIGLDVIVTDHHECPETIPNCIAVIDAKRPDNTYPFNSLAGVGVSFKLIQALCIKLNLPKEDFLKYLDIVALGTVADIVPLIDENRIIVKYGLEKMRETTNVGLKALITTSDFKTIDSSTISFGLAPRMNACGRMGKAEKATQMLLTDEYEEALQIAQELQKMNKERQEIEKNIIDETLSIIDEKNLKDNKIIIVGNENWHHGVIGIVASKITEEYYKPSILVCFEGNEGKGSGRSVDGFDLHSALVACDKYLEKYGGHEMAIGLTIKKENFENFKKAMLEYSKDKLPDDLIPTIRYDADINSNIISKQTIEELKKLEPYGEANPMPIFNYKNVRVDSVRTLSNDKHLKLNIKDNHKIFGGIAFNLGNMKDSIRMGDKLDVLCRLEINQYNGIESIQLNIKDIKKSI